MYLYIARERKGDRVYRYLVVEEKIRVNGKRRSRRIIRIRVDDAIKLLLILKEWCGGWDLNPRRPTPSGPKPDPFDLARAPPRLLLG